MANAFLKHHENQLNKAVSAYLDDSSPSWLKTESASSSSGFGFIEKEEEPSSSGFGFISSEKDETTTSSSSFGFIEKEEENKGTGFGFIKNEKTFKKPKVAAAAPKNEPNQSKKKSLVPESMMYKGGDGTLNLKFGKKKRRKRKKKIGIGRGSTPVDATPPPREEEPPEPEEKKQTSLLSGLTIHKTPTRVQKETDISNLDASDPLVQALQRGDITRSEFDAIKRKSVYTPDEIDHVSPDVPKQRKAPPPVPVPVVEKPVESVEEETKELSATLDTLNDLEDDEGDADFLQGLTLRRQSSDSSTPPTTPTQDSNPVESFTKASRETNERLLKLDTQTKSLIETLKSIKSELEEIEANQQKTRKLQNEALESEDYESAETFETNLQKFKTKSESLLKREQDSKRELTSLHSARQEIYESRIESIDSFLSSIESSRGDREAKLSTMRSQVDARTSRLEITKKQYVVITLNVVRIRILEHQHKQIPESREILKGGSRANSSTSRFVHFRIHSTSRHCQIGVYESGTRDRASSIRSSGKRDRAEETKEKAQQSADQDLSSGGHIQECTAKTGRS